MREYGTGLSRAEMEEAPFDQGCAAGIGSYEALVHIQLEKTPPFEMAVEPTGSNTGQYARAEASERDRGGRKKFPEHFVGKRASTW